jgi:hypothetical protein
VKGRLVSIPTALPILLMLNALAQHLTTISRLTTIELLHPVLRDACSAIFNSFTLLVPNHMPVDSQRAPWVTVPELLLHHSRSCSVREQGTGCTVTHRMESAGCDTQLHQQG